MELRFRNWPFAPNEIVTLHWLRSPYHVGSKKQWQMRAVFRREDGTLRDVAVPWGALPALCLGLPFSDGKHVREHPYGDTRRIHFDSSPKVGLCGARQIPRDYPLRNHVNLAERCVFIRNRNEVIIVPCLEVIRAYFGLNRMMTAELLRPDSFNGVCSTTLRDGEVHLDFSDKVAPHSVSSDLVAQRIALIHFAPEFDAAWKQVWGSAAPRGGADIRQGEPAHPLQVMPPVLAGSTWDIRGKTFGPITLVLEIKGIIFGGRSPISQVSYSHPRINDYEGEGGGGTGGTWTVEEPVEVSIAPQPKPPKDLTAPRMVRSRFTPANFAEPIPVEKLKQTLQGGNGGSRPSGVRHKPVPSAEVTFYEEAGVGELPAAEFVSVGSRANLSPCFKNLFDAFKCINDVKLDVHEGEAPEGCLLPSLPKTSGNPRPYVVVSVLFSGRRFFLLEVDGQNDHGLSTLLFLLSPDELSVAVFSERILKEGIAAGGHWDREKLKALFQKGRYQLAKHTQTSPPYHNWGMRLFRTGQRLLSQG